MFICPLPPFPPYFLIISIPPQIFSRVLVHWTSWNAAYFNIIQLPTLLPVKLHIRSLCSLVRCTHRNIWVHCIRRFGRGTIPPPSPLFHPPFLVLTRARKPSTYGKTQKRFFDQKIKKQLWLKQRQKENYKERSIPCDKRQKKENSE